MSKEFNSDTEELKNILNAHKRKAQNFQFNYDNEVSDNKIDDAEAYVDNYDADNEINSYSGDEIKEQMEQDSKKAQKRRKKDLKKEERRKNKKNKRLFRLIWLVSVIIVGAVLSVYLLVGINDMLAINRTESAKVNVELPENPSMDQIANALTASGVINEPNFFKMYAVLTRSDKYFTQGSYDVQTNLDYEAIINYLQSMANRTDTIKVTLTEGESVIEVANTLKNAGVIDKTDEFLSLCNSNDFDEDYTFLKDIPNADKRYYKLEGYLYPDTYEFYVNEDPTTAINRFLSNFETHVYTKQSIQGYDKKIKISDQVSDTKYSMDEILTIASIIQAEAADNDDMYYISSILYNRLENGEASGTASLGLDSTKYYPYRSEDTVPSDIKSTFSSTYSTYDFTGLPPGPICNPGTQAIEAAINPKSTSYLYFCHAADGTPYYASSLAQHNYNLSLAGVQ